MHKAQYLCERCLSRGIYTPAEIVHHIEPLRPDNVTNRNITLSFDNLMAVCRKCHEEIHHETNTAAKHRKYKKRYTVDKDGNVTTNPEE